MDGVSAIADLVAALRERTWLAPVSAEEMNQRDRWLADQLEAALALLRAQPSPPPLPVEPKTPERWARACAVAVDLIGRVNSGADLATEIAGALMGFVAYDKCPCVCHSFPDHPELQDALDALKWHQKRCAWYAAELDKLKAGAQPSPSPGWQPISTAPKDGTRFIGGCYHRVYGWIWSWARFYNEDQDGIGAPYVVMEGGGTPTHWMPLPLPPAGIGAADQEAGDAPQEPQG